MGTSGSYRIWVFLPLLPVPESDSVPLVGSADPGSAGFGFAAEGGQVVVVDDFGGNESAFEIGVDHSGSGGSFVALSDRPRTGFLNTCG
jgi:hypothetical protein